MKAFTVFSAAEQVAAHLRAELLRGGLSGTMPGVYPLAAELGVNHKTVKLALTKLEEEGLLVGRGRGRERRIVLPEGGLEAPALRVALLAFDAPARGEEHMIELRHLLAQSGHVAFFPAGTLQRLGMEAGRVARFVRSTAADAWVVGAGSREVLESFAEQEAPAFALFGRRGGLLIAGAGPDKAPVCGEVARHLIALGHRRISVLCRRQLRLPQPGRSLRAFLGELEAAGIVTGDYNLPDWKESREGFGRLLDSLFGRTPPTALILDEPFLYHAAHSHLARRGLQVPKDVSLVCTDSDPTFAWCRPTVAHIHWDYRPVVRRIVRWANHVARGKDERRQTWTKAEFVEGGSLGKAKD